MVDDPTINEDDESADDPVPTEDGIETSVVPEPDPEEEDA